MKATGIVRRIDELGRVVIPKEIRRTQRIRRGDPLEIFTTGDGEVIFKKYSPMGEVNTLAAQLAEVLSRQFALTAFVCDRDRILAVSGSGRRELTDRSISQPLEKLMEARKPYQSPGNPEKTLLQVRFMVSEGAVGIRGNATSRTDIDYNGSNQQLEFRVDLNRYPVRDAFNDLSICITQNGRTDNPAIVTHPSRMEGNTLVYEHQPQLIFPAGNEYRRMETVQMQYPGMRIDHIDYFAPYYHHFVELDKPRHSSLYTYDSTQHGRFFVREYNADDSDTEADYSVVHFVLDMLPVPGADVYIEGDFTNRRFDESSKMAYDSEAGVYHKEMLLKQGAYNYQYLTLPAGVQHGTKRRDATPLNNGVNAKALSAVTEGNFYQTVNEYLVTVYYRAPGERYDRLLGCTLIYSGE